MHNYFVKIPNHIILSFPLVRTGAVSVYLVGRVYAAMAVTCATAPLAVLFIVTVLVDLVWTVDTAMTIA